MTRAPVSRLTVPTIVRRLRRMIGRLPEGRRLPPERTLSAELGCSRSTLRAALLQLEASGLIWRHVGQGTFAGVRPGAEPLRRPVLLEQTSPGDLMVARRIIEPAVAAAAARHAQPADIERLRTLAVETSNAADWRTYEAADEAFHRAIAAATGSRLIIAVLDLLSAVRSRVRWRRQHDRAFRAAHAQAYSRAQGALHTALVEAISAGDADRAGAVMSDHMRQIESLMAGERDLDL